MNMSDVKITGIGSYIPERRISNKDWKKLLSVDDDWLEWIIETSGVCDRSRIEAGQSITDMAVKASLIALDRTGSNKPESLDLIICATSSPDDILPSAASKIQGKLNASNATSFDIMASCSGWIFGMRTAVSMIQTNQAKKALIVGTEAHSRIMNFHDRSNIIFGDAAGAAIVERADENGSSKHKLCAPIFSCGTIPSNAIQLPTVFTEEFNSMEGYFAGKDMAKIKRPFSKINGKAARKLAFESKKSMDDVLARAGAYNISQKDIDLFVPHQTTKTMVKEFCEHIGYPFEKIPYTLNKYGSVGSAGIPTGICEHYESGKIRKGDLILCHTFGAGFTYGSMLFEWA